MSKLYKNLANHRLNLHQVEEYDENICFITESLDSEVGHILQEQCTINI